MAGKWHPMEMGPKTGREVLLYHPKMGRFVGFWDSRRKEWKENQQRMCVEPQCWADVLLEPPEW